MPSIAHFSFYVEMMKFVGENEKKCLIDKICMMALDKETLNLVLAEKWNGLAKEKKWFDCL